MGDSSEDPHKQLEAALKHLEEMSKKDPEIIKKQIWDTASAISFLVVEAKRARFKAGWSANLKDVDGDPVFTEEDMKLVEGIVDTYVKPLFGNDNQTVQSGGSVSAIPIIPTSKGLIQRKLTPGMVSGLDINPENLSLDVMFWKAKKFIDSLDEQAHRFSREVGPFKFFYDSPIDFRIPLPFLAAVPIPPRVIPVLLEVVVESVRVIYGVGPMSNDLVRKILSVVLAVIDVSKGNWKHAILSIAGFFGKNPMIAGLIGKVFLTVLQKIAPDILNTLIFTKYASVKSFLIGSAIWIVTTFSPDLVRKSISKSLDELSGPLGPLGKARAIVEQKMASDPKYELRLKEVLASLTLSFDDLQNLQMIARQPAIMCSKDFQDALDGVRKVPPLRLVFELFNIPTDPDSVEYMCGQFKNLPLEQTLQSGLDALKPEPLVMAEPVTSPSLAVATAPEAVAAPLAVATPVKNNKAKPIAKPIAKPKNKSLKKH
jgi:hypothetical protein